MSATMEDKEVSLSEVLPSFLTDEGLCDVTLQGTDGVRVKANRYILAARSKVFRQTVLGDFVEASSPVVKLGYEGKVLQAVVEYICSDTAHILNPKKRKREEDKQENFNTEIPMLISLACAAQYHNLPGLLQKIQDAISVWMEEEAGLYCFGVLDAVRSQGPSVPEELSTLAMKCVRKNAKNHVNSSAVASLSSSVVEKILEDEEMEMSELDLFHLLRLWVEANPSERKPTGEALLEKHISLEQIDPLELSTTVTSSGLAKNNLLSKAYKAQALLAREKNLDGFQKCRGNSDMVWKGSKSTSTGSTNVDRTTYETDLLDCPPIVSGLYQWTIEHFESGTKYSWIGIVAADGPRADKAIWRWDCGWGISNRGGYCHHARRYVRNVSSLNVGKSATLTLNLLPDDEQNGSLTWQVEGGEEETAFTNLRHHLNAYPRGFLPAVSSVHPARFRLVDFRKVN